MIQTFEELGYDLNRIANLPGMYIISDGESLAIASRCNYDTPHTIELEADCLMVWFVRGSIMSLLNHLDHTDLSHIIFERNGGGKGIFKKYNFQRFYRHMVYQQKAN